MLLLLLLLRLRFLTNKGIEYLREYLNLPADVVPATLKKSARPAGEGRRPPMGGDRPPRGPPREGGYRCALPLESICSVSALDCMWIAHNRLLKNVCRCIAAHP
jgi:hypothetical protein